MPEKGSMESSILSLHPFHEKDAPLKDPFFCSLTYCLLLGEGSGGMTMDTKVGIWLWIGTGFFTLIFFFIRSTLSDVRDAVTEMRKNLPAIRNTCRRLNRTVRKHGEELPGINTKVALIQQHMEQQDREVKSIKQQISLIADKLDKHHNVRNH